VDNDVAGIHFYTLNRSDTTRTIFDSLGIPRQRNTQVPIAWLLRSGDISSASGRIVSGLR
jgi:hypothetical protein